MIRHVQFAKSWKVAPGLTAGLTEPRVRARLGLIVARRHTSGPQLQTPPNSSAVLYLDDGDEAFKSFEVVSAVICHASGDGSGCGISYP